MSLFLGQIFWFAIQVDWGCFHIAFLSVVKFSLLLSRNPCNRHWVASLMDSTTPSQASIAFSSPVALMGTCNLMLIHIFFKNKNRFTMTISVITNDNKIQTLSAHILSWQGKTRTDHQMRISYQTSTWGFSLDVQFKARPSWHNRLPSPRRSHRPILAKRQESQEPRISFLFLHLSSCQ